MTLTMADSAEIAHMPTVSANSQNASPGVITRGSAEFRLAYKNQQRDDHAERIADDGAEAGLRQE